MPRRTIPASGHHPVSSTCRRHGARKSIIRTAASRRASTNGTSAFSAKCSAGSPLEVSYVGNRGHGLEANNLISYNATPLERFTERGLDLNNAADRQLLTSRIDSPLAASRGFGKPYPSFPGSATVAQSLRPFPQFNDGLAVRWAPLGQTWYDALHLNVTKRQWHNLGLTAAFTYQKERALGSGGNPSAGGGPTNNVFDREAQKGLAANSQPLIFVTSFNYRTPRTRRRDGCAPRRLDVRGPLAVLERRLDSGRLVRRTSWGRCCSRTPA